MTLKFHRWFRVRWARLDKQELGPPPHELAGALQKLFVKDYEASLVVSFQRFIPKTVGSFLRTSQTMQTGFHGQLLFPPSRLGLGHFCRVFWLGTAREASRLEKERQRQRRIAVEAAGARGASRGRPVGPHQIKGRPMEIHWVWEKV